MEKINWHAARLTSSHSPQVNLKPLWGGVALKFCLRLPIPRFVHSRYGVGLPSFAGIRSVLYSDTPRQWDSIGNNFELEFDRELYEDERVSQLAFNQLAYPFAFFSTDES